MNHYHDESQHATKKCSNQSGAQSVPSGEGMGRGIEVPSRMGAGKEFSERENDIKADGNNQQNQQFSLVIENGEYFVDTRDIADMCEIQHKNIKELIVNHLESIEGSFGTVAFQTEPSRARGGGGDGSQFACLTEDQATFLITLTRNTAPVIRFKAALVKAFRDARNQIEGKFKLPKTLSEALILAGQQAAEVERLALDNAKLDAIRREMTPKAEFFDCAMTSRDTILIRDAAKLLNPKVPGGCGEKRLFKWLRENKWLFGENRPYQDKIDAGYVVATETPIPTNTRGTIMRITVRITQRGLVAIHRALTAITPADWRIQ
jgi:phage antirepressor YoqD-like protein/anti-sigma28 factor (negative regulator of flagellin synthesis)